MDRVCQRRGDRRHRRFAETGRVGVRLGEMGLDHERRFVDAQQTVVAEITLDDATVRDRDAFAKRRRQPLDDPALDLGAAAVGVGTALFYDPLICAKINDGIRAYLAEHGLATVADLSGSLQLPQN